MEIYVKFVKRLIFGSIKTNILKYHDFEFLVSYVIHLVNRRPIAFKESLRETNLETVPEPITPEHLTRGYELTSLNLIPDLQAVPIDPDWLSKQNPSSIRDEYSKLRKVREELLDRYQEEFLATLIAQAVDRKDRYLPVTHKGLFKGDVVLLKEVNVKPNYYPLGIVKEITHNDNGEVTGALVMKGKSRELVKRHSSSIIPLLRNDNVNTSTPQQIVDPNSNRPPSRRAALDSRERTRLMLND